MSMPVSFAILESFPVLMGELDEGPVKLIQDGRFCVQAARVDTLDA